MRPFGITALCWIAPVKAGRAPVVRLVTGAFGTLRTFVVQALKHDAGVFHRGNRAGVTGTEGMRDRMAYCDFRRQESF